MRCGVKEKKKSGENQNRYSYISLISRSGLRLYSLLTILNAVSNQWMPCVTGSTQGQISPLLLSVLCWKGFTLEEGSSGAFLFLDGPSDCCWFLESPTSSRPCWCCLRRCTLPCMPLPVVGLAALSRENLYLLRQHLCLLCFATPYS